MSDTGTLNSDAQTGGAQLTPAVANEAVSIPLSELNKALGKDFKDTATAIKSLTDTQSFVGKRREDIIAEHKANQSHTPPVATPNNSSNVEKLSADMFYLKHPEYNEHRDLISKLGANPEEVVNSDTFKNIHKQLLEAKDVTSKRSVVASNARLQQSTSELDQIRQNARTQGSTETAEALAGLINREMGVTQ